MGFINAPYRRNDKFIRRDPIQEKIQLELEAGNDVLIWGLPGNGKTQLALEMGYILGGKGRKVIWCNSSSPNNLIRSYREFVRPEYGDTENASDNQILTAFSEWCRNNRDWLIIYDNYFNENFNEGAEFDKYLPKNKNGQIIITSQVKHNCTEAKDFRLEEFDLLEAQEFISSGTTSDYDIDSITALYERLSDSPLAIAQTVKYLNKAKTTSIEEYINLLNDTKLELLNSKTEIPDHKMPILESLSLLLERLKTESPSAMKFLCLMSLFPNYRIGGYTLNRLFFEPYRFNGNNYEEIKLFPANEPSPELSKKVTFIPLGYCKGGNKALDKDVAKYFDSIGLPIYKNHEFINIVSLLEDYGLATRIIAVKKYANMAGRILPSGNDMEYFCSIDGVIIRIDTVGEFVKNISDTYENILLLLEVLYYSGPYRKHFRYSDIIENTNIYDNILNLVLQYREKLLEDDNEHIRELFIYIASASFHMRTGKYSFLSTKDTCRNQEECWNFILEYSKKFESEDQFAVRNLEKCIALPSYNFTSTIRSVEEAANFFKRHGRDKEMKAIILYDCAARNDFDAITIDDCLIRDESELKKIKETKQVTLEQIYDTLFKYFSYDAYNILNPNTQCYMYGNLKFLDESDFSEIKKIFKKNNNLKSYDNFIKSYKTTINTNFQCEYYSGVTLGMKFASVNTQLDIVTELINIASEALKKNKYGTEI